jgi:hypothetical protein
VRQADTQLHVFFCYVDLVFKCLIRNGLPPILLLNQQLQKTLESNFGGIRGRSEGPEGRMNVGKALFAR